MTSQNKKARTYEEFKAENKEKFRVLFTSSDDESESEHEDMRLDRHFSVASSSNSAVNNQLPNSSSTPSEIAYHGGKLVDTDGYKSLSSKKGSCQHWTRLCNWWETSKAEIIPKLLLDADIFPQNLQAYLSKPISEVLFAITHLQRAHLLSEYVRSLKPQVKDITHLGGNSIKNYVDAIVRKMRNLENGKTTLSSFYGNWSWNTNNEYSTLRKTIALKVSEEDTLYRGKKKKSRASDSVTSRTWRLLIQKTLHKRDNFRECNDLPNFIKTNAAAVVHIITYFCGCRAQQEIVDICVLDWTDHSDNCIEFEQTSGTKTRKLKSDYTFTDRESTFVFGKFYCDPIRIFLNKRSPNAIDRFFLYSLPSARFEDLFWLTAAMPIGKGPISKAVQSQLNDLIAENLVPPGNYTNTSLRKGLSNTLARAHVPPVLVDCMLGHFCTKRGEAAAGLRATPNLIAYADLYKQAITRKKLALILFNEQLTWFDVDDEDYFHQAYMNFFPSEQKTAQKQPVHQLPTPHNDNSAIFLKSQTSPPIIQPTLESDLDTFEFDFLPCVSPTPRPQTTNTNHVPTFLPGDPPVLQPNAQSDEEWDELIMSLTTPPRLQHQQQTQFQDNFFPQAPQTAHCAQTNNALSFASNIAPTIHIHGGTVNFTFVTGSERK